MKAHILYEAGSLRYEEVPIPHPQAGEVLVQVKASGICGSDIARIYKTGAHVSPLIPGHEFSGIVAETGEGTDRAWLGRRVGIFPLIPCRTCAPCRRGQYEMCRNYSYLGSRRDGGFAEYVTVPEENLLELPQEVSFEAAAMLEPMAVAVHAMRRLPRTKRGAVAVCGLGTIGLLILMFLQEAGLEDVYVIGNKDFQKQSTLLLGVSPERFCDSRTQDAGSFLAERTGGLGVEAFFECVGRNETINLAVAGTAPGGAAVLVGNPYSSMTFEKDLYWKILRNQLTVTGTWNSSFTNDPDDDWQYVLARLKGGNIRPESLITHRFPLEELTLGLSIMRDKTEDYVKVMALL